LTGNFWCCQLYNVNRSGQSFSRLLLGFLGGCVLWFFFRAIILYLGGGGGEHFARTPPKKRGGPAEPGQGARCFTFFTPGTSWPGEGDGPKSGFVLPPAGAAFSTAAKNFRDALRVEPGLWEAFPGGRGGAPNRGAPAPRRRSCLHTRTFFLTTCTFKGRGTRAGLTRCRGRGVGGGRMGGPRARRPRRTGIVILFWPPGGHTRQ